MLYHKYIEDANKQVENKQTFLVCPIEIDVLLPLLVIVDALLQLSFPLLWLSVSLSLSERSPIGTVLEELAGVAGLAGLAVDEDAVPEDMGGGRSPAADRRLGVFRLSPLVPSSKDSSCMLRYNSFDGIEDAGTDTDTGGVVSFLLIPFVITRGDSAFSLSLDRIFLSPLVLIPVLLEELEFARADGVRERVECRLSGLRDSPAS
jgi:hypothetical protein